MRFGISVLALATAVSAVPSHLIERQTSFQTTPIATFNEPWALAFLPDARILVTEKAGPLRLVNPDTRAVGQITGVPAIQYSGQGGLHDVAVHPNYAENKLVYISYAEAPQNGASSGAVARATLTLNQNGGGALQNIEVIWRQSPPVASNGQFALRILFDNDGFLWITSGERQLATPAQDMSGNMGKIIRLNDDGTVPADNPFADQGGVTAQIWSLGIRNPLGFDFDIEGRLWEIEMGPMGGDELNLIQPEGNYGWPVVSEGDNYDGTPIPNHNTRPEFIPPKVAWVPVISPAGMIIYKGDLFADWKNNVLISAVGQQGIVRVRLEGENASEAQRIPMGRRMRAIKEDAQGALWVLEDSFGGRLLKLTPS
ncbi:soluble quino protein glucose dehydrogenase [Sarocladium strictum]